MSVSGLRTPLLPTVSTCSWEERTTEEMRWDSCNQHCAAAYTGFTAPSRASPQSCSLQLWSRCPRSWRDPWSIFRSRDYNVRPGRPGQQREHQDLSRWDLDPLVTLLTSCPSFAQWEVHAQHHLLLALGGPAVSTAGGKSRPRGPHHPLHLALPGHLATGRRPDPAGVDVGGPRAI